MATQYADLVPTELRQRLDQAVDIFESVDRVRVICHYDADGTTAGAVLASAMNRHGEEYHISMSRNLDEAAVRRLGEEDVDLLIFSDMGSGQLEWIERLESKVIVLDHHQPLQDSQKVVHVNPSLFGMSGTREICGSTTTFLLALALDEANWDIAGVALAGAIADRQHIGGFAGLNRSILEHTIQRGIVEVRRGLALRDAPLAEALESSVIPYFFGVSGRKEVAESFVRELKISPSKHFKELGAEERRRLSSFLALSLLKQGAAPEAINSLSEEKYWIRGLGMDAGELSAYVNACCRLHMEGLGLSLCLGDSGALREAEIIRSKYAKQILSILHGLEEKGPEQRKYIQSFSCESPTLNGAVAEVAMQYFFDQTRPTLGLAAVKDESHVSARGTRALVERGLDLAAALRESADRVGGHGGGHNIAAGATLPEVRKEEFLLLVDEIVGKQLTRPSSA